MSFALEFLEYLNARSAAGLPYLKYTAFLVSRRQAVRLDNQTLSGQDTSNPPLLNFRNLLCRDITKGKMGGGVRVVNACLLFVACFTVYSNRQGNFCFALPTPGTKPSTGSTLHSLCNHRLAKSFCL